VLDSAVDHGDDTSFLTGLLFFRYSAGLTLIFIHAEYLPGDEFSDICRITLAPDEEHDYASRSIPGPGEYEITWRR